MINLFHSILFLAHFQAVIIPIFFGFKSIKKFKNIENNSLIPFGFYFLGLASLFEMIDHTQTNWIYIDHSSIYNWLFYSFLSLGLISLSISIIKNKLYIGINLFLSIFSITSYLIIDKSVSILFQIIISILCPKIWTTVTHLMTLLVITVFIEISWSSG